MSGGGLLAAAAQGVPGLAALRSPRARPVGRRASPGAPSAAPFGANFPPPEHPRGAPPPAGGGRRARAAAAAADGALPASPSPSQCRGRAEGRLCRSCEIQRSPGRRRQRRGSPQQQDEPGLAGRAWGGFGFDRWLLSLAFR